MSNRVCSDMSFIIKLQHTLDCSTTQAKTDLIATIIKIINNHNNRQTSTMQRTENAHVTNVQTV